MKIIMLAAGKGSRLMPLTANTPKMLVDLGSGKTLIETQLENIEKSGVIEEVIVGNKLRQNSRIIEVS